MANLPMRYIIDQVDRLVEDCGSRDPFEICESLGIQVFEDDLKQAIKGYFFCYQDTRVCVYDSNLIKVFRPILVAHELGHAVLHQELALLHSFQEMDVLDNSTAQPEEYEANLFAAELLLTDEAVIEALNGESFFEAARQLNVPAALLDFKFSLMQRKGYQIRRQYIAGSDFMKQELGAYDSNDYIC